MEEAELREWLEFYLERSAGLYDEKLRLETWGAELVDAKDEIADTFDGGEDDLEEHRQRVRELIEEERDVLDELASQEDGEGEDL